MTTLTVPTPEAGSKPAQILEAAGKLFLENGYGAVSMDAVAKTANVSKATLYAHFGSKEELFRTMVACECHSYAQATIWEEARRMEVAEGLRLLGRRFAALLMSPKALAGYRMVVGEAHRFPELARAFYEAGPARSLAQMTDFMADADRRGQLSIPSPRLAAEQFMGMIKSHLHMRLLFGLDQSPEAEHVAYIVDNAVALIVKGYAKG
ncbi:TetR/AcrR family transcriptional regulator [Azospirillum sp. SYSU D00513]|uniref:TetR/AcrR family transcriptional regulator n=1 Tax=Azospirillum sp. SYSU D00513 TaxID=2812561 RepID=UPI001A965484|nr:TetR/AcrR family transcriptional regulator [Azospirillum sp. SYSU D00513]